MKNRHNLRIKRLSKENGVFCLRCPACKSTKVEKLDSSTIRLEHHSGEYDYCLQETLFECCCGWRFRVQVRWNLLKTWGEDKCTIHV